ncbi:MAG: PAS domain-containing protein, partial [Gemmatirosa sp.]
MPVTPPVVGVAMGVGEEVTEADDAFLTIVRYTREDLEVGRMNWAAMTPPEFLHLDLAGTRQAAASGGFTVPYQKEFIRKDGSHVPVLMVCSFIPDTTGKWMCYVVDLSPPSTQRPLPVDARTTLGTTPAPHDFYARLVNELVRERTRMLAMLGNTETLFWAVDGELRLLGANAAFQAAQGEAIGHPLPIGESVLTPEFPEEVRARWQRRYARALAGERFVELTDHVTSDGTRSYESAFSPIVDPQDGVVGVSVVAHDVTARRHAEEALRA